MGDEIWTTNKACVCGRFVVGQEAQIEASWGPYAVVLIKSDQQNLLSQCLSHLEL